MKYNATIMFALAIILAAPFAVSYVQIDARTQSNFTNGIDIGSETGGISLNALSGDKWFSGGSTYFTDNVALTGIANFSNQICLNGSCITSWPSGSGTSLSGLNTGQILAASSSTNASTKNIYFVDNVADLRTYAAIRGASIFVAAGNYTVSSSPILVASNVSIQANPRTAFFNAASGLNTHVFASNGRVSYVTITGIDVNGNSASNTAGDCMRFDGFFNTFDNLWVQNCAESGLRLNATAASSENRIQNGRYNATHSGIRIDSGNQDFYIHFVTFNGGRYGLYSEGNGGHVSYLNFFGQTIANLYTNAAMSTFGLRFGSAPIGLFINGTANNIIGIWSGMNLNAWTTDNLITNALIVANITSPYTMYLNVNNWVGTYTAEDLRLLGDGTSRLAITSTYKTLSINNTGNTIDSQSYVIQPLRSATSAPTVPVAGMIYLDSGANTGNSLPGLRRYNTSGSWADLSPTSAFGSSAYHVAIQGSNYVARASNGAVLITSTNASRVINAALGNASLNGRGGKVSLGSGLFSLDSSIVISQSNLTLEGEGFGTQLRLSSGVNRPVINITGTNVRYVRVRSMFIDGQRDTNPSSFGVWISTPYSTGDTHHVLEDLDIWYAGLDNVHVTGDTRVIWMNRIHTYFGNRNGYRIGGSDHQFSNLIAEGNVQDGFYVTASNTHWTNVKAFGNGAGATTYAGFTVYGINNRFTNCEAQENYNYGFFTDSSSATEVSLVGCAIDNNGINTSSSNREGIRIFGASNWQIIGTSFTNWAGRSNQTHGISLGGSVTNITVVGSSFARLATAAFEFDAAADQNGTLLLGNTGQGVSSVVFTSNPVIRNLSGSGNDYACLDSNGMLFRSNTAC